MKRGLINRKGLSTIIVTLILIVISLAAIGVFWLIISNVIKGGSEQIGLDRFIVDAEIKNVGTDNSSNNVSLTFKRKAGAGDMTGIKFVFTDGFNTEMFTEEFTLKELEERRFVFHFTKLLVDNLLTISIVPMIKTADGKEIIGNILGTYNIKQGNYQAGTTTPTECVSATCSGLGFNCGTWSNGTCGGTLNCGTTCGTGYYCDSGTCVANQTTCAPAVNPCGSACGIVANGTCGNIDCGGCSSGYTCVGGTCVIATAHPRMFFTSADITSLRQKAQTTHSEIWNFILDEASDLLGTSPAAEPTTISYDAYFIPADDLIISAFAYIITNNTQYLDLARDRMVAYAGWASWGYGSGSGNDGDLALGEMLLSNSLAYDWLYNNLNSTDRTIIKNSLLNRIKILYDAARNSSYDPYLNNWWRKSYIHNHWSKPISGFGVAALVLEGENESVTTYLNYAINEIRKDSTLSEGIGDGTYHEGMMYQEFKFQNTLPFYYNLKRIKNIDMPNNYLINFSFWRMYNQLPNTARMVIPFADTNPDWNYYSRSPWGLLRFVAGMYNNGYAEWLAQKMLSLSTRSNYGTSYTVFEFFYYDNSISSVSPTNLPLDRTFKDLGVVIWKTGWTESDITFGIKAGTYGGKFAHESFISNTYPFNISGSTAHTGHDHSDFNGFYLYKGSVDLSSEKEHYASAPGGDTSYHNTIMVDQEDQYRSNWYSSLYPNTDAKLGNIYETPDFNYLMSDATNLYREKASTGDGVPTTWIINEFTRRVVFSKPNYIVMVDNLRSDTSHRYDWISHIAVGGSISVESDWVRGTINDAGNNILGIKVLSPTGFSYDTGLSTALYDTKDKPYIRIRPSTNVANTRFINILYPLTSSTWASKPTITSLGDTTSGAGVRVALSGTQDHLFRYGSSSQITIGEYVLTGEVASILKDTGGTLTSLFLGNGTSLSDTSGTRSLVSATSAKTFEAVYSGSALALYGSSLSGLSIYGPSISASQVTINGQFASATKNGNYILIN